MQPQRAPPSASASLAATKAFVRDRESNGNLSSAAAAAALRTHVTTPTPVGDTVTKRMVRRNSVSSNGSNQGPGLLRRQSSSGSMTERSFRAASPGRGSPADPNAPPVPTVPKNIPQSSAVHRRASSLEPAIRGGSPAPRGRGRGVSLDRGEQSTAPRGQRPPSHLAHVSEEDDAAGRSVNFSRPMSPGTPTPKQSPSQQAGRGWFGGPVLNQEAVQRMASTSRPKTSSGIPDYDLRNAQQSVQNAVNRPVKTHQYAQGVEGSRLSSGSMRAKPSGTAVQSRSFLPSVAQHAPRPVDPNSPNAIYDPSTRTFIHKQDAMARHRELHQEPDHESQQYVSHHVDDYQPRQIPQHQQAPRSPSPVRQYVQYVREEPPAPQRREVVAGPGSTTVAHMRESEAQPAAHLAPEPRAGLMLEGRNSEDFADADIQSREHANARGQWEGIAQDVKHETPGPVTSPVFTANQDSPYPRLGTPVSTTTTTTKNNIAEQGSDSVRTGHDRQSSLSPPRNAHFAPLAVELAGEKHQPPPRSISPAKSALKPSPSVSRRGSSPIAQNGRLQSRGASSEASDTTSEDGTKKKRSVRVSFEEKPVIAGTAAYSDVETPTSPTGLGASKWSPAASNQDDEFTDFMKPRSALPSFSSIRDKDRRSTEDDVAEKVTETVSTTPMSASVGSIGEPLQASSDHVVGGILAQDFAHKQGSSNDPLPPEVTTVEGSGYVSDSSEDSTLQKHGEEKEPTQQPPVPEPKSLTTPLDEMSSTPGSAIERIVEVPQIALLPATPSPYERPEPKFQSMMIPGGWDEEFLDGSERSVTPTGTVSKEVPAVPVVDPMPQQPTPVLHTEDDTTDDNSSVYSDAYEDLTDTEGGFGSIDAMVEKPVVPSSSGLLSSKYADKNATESVVESPQSKLQIDTSADDDADPETTPTQTSTQDWVATSEHWSGVTAARKQPQHDESPDEQRSHAKDVITRVMQAPVTRDDPRAGPRADHQVVAKEAPKIPTSGPVSQSSTKPLKSALKKGPVAQLAQATESQIRQTMRGAPPRQGASSDIQMKRTMRGGPSTASRAEPQIRSSMRANNDTMPRAGPQMRKSMRSDDTVPPPSMGLAASRHSMLPLDTKPPRGALQKRNIPAAVSAPKPRPQSVPAAKPAAAPAPTYDSDSDASASSFQRTRASRNRNQGGRYTMRGSMRNEPAPTMRATAPAPRQVRSISPPVSPSPAMHKSMRPSSPTPEPVKNSKFSIRSLSPMGRFRSSKNFDAGPPSPTQPKKMPAFNKQPKQKALVAERAKAHKTPIKSRFADSSDEDGDDKPRRFQSRFVDSDSDDEEDYILPPGLAPVRGIPRRAGEEDGDSTDLEEEVDNDNLMPSSTPATKSGPATNGVTNGKSRATANGEGASLATGSLRDSKHAPTLPTFEGGSKTKTKRGFFGLGKKKTTTTQAEAPQPDSAPSGQPDIPLPPAQPSRELGLPLTPIDEDKDFGTPEQASPESKKSPKLQRRSTPEWPLPPPPAIGKDERPMSSDGITPRRPRFGNRQASGMSNVTDPIVDAPGRFVSYGRSGKKKKFQGLRRISDVESFEIHSSTGAHEAATALAFIYFVKPVAHDNQFNCWRYGHLDDML
ncbi:Nn.00g004520.m01.CDS01 [Neocucurbitaria sp. VM-36]